MGTLNHGFSREKQWSAGKERKRPPFASGRRGKGGNPSSVVSILQGDPTFVRLARDSSPNSPDAFFPLIGFENPSRSKIWRISSIRDALIDEIITRNYRSRRAALSSLSLVQSYTLAILRHKRNYRSRFTAVVLRASQTPLMRSDSNQLPRSKM